MNLIASELKFFLEEETYLPFFFDVTAYDATTSAELKEANQDQRQNDISERMARSFSWYSYTGEIIQN